jgi:hypothetical protein
MLALARILQAIYSSGIEDAGAKFGAPKKLQKNYTSLQLCVVPSKVKAEPKLSFFFR